MMMVAARKTSPNDHISSMWPDGTRAGRIRFLTMSVSLSQLLEDSFQIAWEYLERTGELGDAAAASRFLSDTIEIMIRRGQRSRLALSNRAIITYQRHRSSGAVGSAGATCSSA
jgi:hypothetical protein